MDMEEGVTKRDWEILSCSSILFFVFVYCLLISPLFTASNKFVFTSPSISFHRNESCRIAFSCYLRWEHVAKRAWGLTFSLSIKMQIKKQNQVK